MAVAEEDRSRSPAAMDASSEAPAAWDGKPASSRRRPVSRRILFVHGLDSRCPARELAFEFERFGPVNRLDIPSNGRTSSTAYAFVEFQRAKDAEEAYRCIHGRRFRYGTIKVEWAKRLPRVFQEEDDQKHRRGRSQSPNARSPSRSPSASRSPGPVMMPSSPTAAG